MNDFKECPKCNTNNDASLKECPGCGIIFSKYRAMQERTPISDKNVEASKNKLQILIDKTCESSNFVKGLFLIVCLFLVYDHFFALKEITIELDGLLENESDSFKYLEKTYGSAEAYPMIILLHGSGADEEDLLPIFEDIAYPLRVISFRGPVRSGSGYAWAYGRGKDKREAQKNYYSILEGVGNGLAEIISELKDKYSTKGKPMVFGFSKGAELAYYLAAYFGDDFSMIFPVSGSLSSELRKQPPVESKRLRIYAFHGKSDTVTPLAGAKHTKQWFESNKRKIYLSTHSEGHRIPEAVIDEIKLKISEL